MFSRRQKGFTLLELVVVVGVMGALAVLRLQDARSEIDQARAKQLGIEIYQYNNAVRSYISENPGVAINPPTGTAWLRTAACGGVGARDYLPCNFPDVTTLGDLVYDTNIVVDLAGFTVGTTTMPPLVMDDGQVRADLTGLAALVAAGGSLNAFNPIVAAATDAAFNSSPATAVLTLQAMNNAQNDVWLRTDGANDMDANITYNDGIGAADRGIVNVSFLSSLANETMSVTATELFLSRELDATQIRARAGLTNLGGPAGVLFDPDNAGHFEDGDILAENDLFVDERLIVGAVDTMDPWNGGVMGHGDIAVGSDVFVDETVVINGVTLSSQLGVATDYGAVNMTTSSDSMAAGAFYDRDDTDFYLKPSLWSKLNAVHTTGFQIFGDCTLGVIADCFDQNNIYGTQDNAAGIVDNPTPAILSGFANVDNLYVQKHFINDWDAPVDPISGNNNDKDWRWVSLQRLLPDNVHQSSYVVTRLGGTSGSITVPKPVCGDVAANQFDSTNTNRNAGIPKIVLTPMQLPVNTDLDDQICESGDCDSYLRSGFILAAVTTNTQSYWEIVMGSVPATVTNLGSDAMALAQTYCFYGHRGTANGG